MAQDWTVNTYVRACGNLRSLDNKRSMLAFRIKPVKDYDEITFHNLQCIFQHLHLTKGPMLPGAGPMQVCAYREALSSA